MSLQTRSPIQLFLIVFTACFCAFGLIRFIEHKLAPTQTAVIYSNTPNHTSKNQNTRQIDDASPISSTQKESSQTGKQSVDDYDMQVRNAVEKQKKLEATLQERTFVTPLPTNTNPTTSINSNNNNHNNTTNATNGGSNAQQKIIGTAEITAGNKTVSITDEEMKQIEQEVDEYIEKQNTYSQNNTTYSQQREADPSQQAVQRQREQTCRNWMRWYAEDGKSKSRNYRDLACKDAGIATN